MHEPAWRSARPFVTSGLPGVVRLFRVFILMTILGCAFQSVAQDLRYLRHQAWSTEDGLPQDSVAQILQTGDGFLWIAGEGGVARFDGVSFRSFDHRNEPAFASDDACCLAEDGDGALWIGTADGLLRYIHGEFTRYAEKSGLPSPVIRALRAGVEGSLLVQTATGSAERHGERFAPSNRSIEAPGGSPVQSSMHGELWSYSNTAVSLQRNGSPRRWFVGQDFPGSRVETVFVDRLGRAWVGTNKGLTVLSARSEQASPVPALNGGVVLQIFEDREGNEWVGTETSGLHVLRPVKFRTEPALADQEVTTIAAGILGRVWIGTRREGLRLMRGAEVSTPVATNKLTSPLILSLAPGENGSVWAGTPDGLNHVAADGAVEQFTSASGLPDDYIQALASDGARGVWVGTRRGLVHLSGGAPDIFTRTRGLSGDLVGALLHTKNGDLWAATSGGLSRLGPDGSLKNFALHSTPSAGIVSAMTEDALGNIWLGYRDGALSRIAEGVLRTANLTGVTAGIDGLAADAKGYLWLRTRQGVDRISVVDVEACLVQQPAVPCAPRMSRYGRADGLPSVELVQGSAPALIKTDTGELWIASRRGVAITDPEHLALNEVPPPVVIERVLADDAPLATNGPALEIRYGPKRFTFDYAGLTYTAPSEVRYRYKLEGLDETWTDAGARRSATYTNLKPARYQFRVQARNNDGIWNETGATLAFRIVPPFYRRWWFLALALLCLAALGAGLYQLRLRSLRLRFDAVLGERNRMAREIHDTLAQDFVGVSLQLDLIAQLLGLKKVEAATEQVQQTRKLVNEGLAEARRSIWDLRANLAQDSLPTRLTQVAERYSDEQLKVGIKIGGAYRKVNEVLESEVLRVAQEALSNVRRHSGATEAAVQLRYEDDMLVLQVQDRGKGFVFGDALRTKDRFGLRGMQERAATVHAELQVESEAGAGTTITMRSPVPSAETKAR